MPSDNKTVYFIPIAKTLISETLDITNKGHFKTVNSVILIFIAIMMSHHERKRRCHKIHSKSPRC